MALRANIEGRGDVVLVSRIPSSLHSAAPSRASFGFERTLGILDSSGVDLTFATHLAAGSTSECQIQNSTRYFNLESGPLISTFAKRIVKLGANVGIGPLVWFGLEIPLEDSAKNEGNF